MNDTPHYGTVKIALAFAGSILGAGYLSGQEIWQFFGAFGVHGIASLFITLFFLSLLVILLMIVARRTGIIEMDRVIIAWNIPAIRCAVAGFEILFIFATVVIMYAGGGSLAKQLFSVPAWTGSLFMCVFVTVIAMKGLSGAMSFFSKVVPPMVFLTVGIGAAALIRFGFPEIPANQSTNPLLGNWLISGITFASYNFFSVIGLMAPTGCMGKSKKSIFAGTLLGSLILLAVALSVLCAMFSVPTASSSQDLPMLEVACALSPVLFYPYGIVLFLAIFGSALYNLVSIVTFLDAKFPRFQAYRPHLLVGLAVFCFPASLFGFGNLISVLYPLIGYCSYVFIICLAYHYFKTRSLDIT